MSISRVQNKILSKKLERNETRRFSAAVFSTISRQSSRKFASEHFWFSTSNAECRFCKNWGKIEAEFTFFVQITVVSTRFYVSVLLLIMKISQSQSEKLTCYCKIFDGYRIGNNSVAASYLVPTKLSVATRNTSGKIPDQKQKPKLWVTVKQWRFMLYSVHDICCLIKCFCLILHCLMKCFFHLVT